MILSVSFIKHCSVSWCIVVFLSTSWFYTIAALYCDPMAMTREKCLDIVTYHMPMIDFYTITVSRYYWYCLHQYYGHACYTVHSAWFGPNWVPHPQFGKPAWKAHARRLLTQSVSMKKKKDWQPPLQKNPQTIRIKQFFFAALLQLLGQLKVVIAASVLGNGHLVVGYTYWTGVGETISTKHYFGITSIFVQHIWA